MSPPLAIGGASVNTLRIVAVRGSGRSETYTQQTDGTWKSAPNTRLVVSQTAEGYQLQRRDGGLEHYNSSGRIISESNLAGQQTLYAYDDRSNLKSVTDYRGNVLTFFYNDAGRLSSVQSKDGTEIRYSYSDSGNLTNVFLPGGTSKTYHYENPTFPRHLTGITDENGSRFATWTYNSAGLVISSQHPETTNGAPQERYSLQFDSSYQTTVTDPLGNKEVFKFFYLNLAVSNHKNLISRTSLVDNKGFTQTFDLRGNLTSRTSESGTKTVYTYNATNQRISMVEASGTSLARTTRYAYLAPGIELVTEIRQPSVAAAKEKITTVKYSTTRLPTMVTISGFTPAGVPVSRTVKMTYDDNGQLIAFDGPRIDLADVTKIEYYDCTTGGACGQLKRATNALGQVTTYDAYDANGRILAITNSNGLRTEYSYDARGNVTMLTERLADSQSRTSVFQYNAIGKLAAASTASGRTLRYRYDAAHYLVEITDDLGNRIEYGYDLKGNRIREEVKDKSNALSRSVQWAYDSRGYVTSINEGGSVTQRLHDAIGRLTAETDPGNTTSRYDYNSLNQLLTTIDALSGVTAYQYDAAGRPKSLTAPNSAVTAFLSDDLGNRLQETSPDRGVLKYSHDAAGNAVAVVDARGVAVYSAYDALNRELSRSFPDAVENIIFTYDTCANGIGKLCAVTDESGETRYSYDGFENVAERIQTVSGLDYTSRFFYDRDDNVIQIDYPAGMAVFYERDPIGRVRSATLRKAGQDQVLVSQATYSADGLLLSQSFGNGVVETRTYSSQRKLASQQFGEAVSVRYAYDAAGNLLSRQVSDSVQQYSYDALDRLVAENASTANLAWTYDSNGNRLTQDIDGAGTPYAYAAKSNRLASVGPRAVELDAAGNTLRASELQFNYNGAGRLRAVERAGISPQEIGRYTYNGQGQRVLKTTAAGTSVYHYGLDGQLLAETNINGQPIRAYVWIDDLPIAQINEYPSDSNITYIYADHLNTPRSAANATGQPVWSWHSSAFGMTAPNEDVDADGYGTIINLRFPGQYFDAETGNHYNYFRTYDPRTGRYLESDPIGLNGGLNTYAYVYNNPLRYTDPLGLMGYGHGAGPFPKPKPLRSGVFGCLVGCASYGQGKAETQVSLEPTIGGGIEICEMPPPQNQCETPKPKNCGMYDPNCDNQLQPPGVPVPTGLGFIVGASIKRDGTKCIRFGLFGELPLIPSLDLGNISE